MSPTLAKKTGVATPHALGAPTAPHGRTGSGGNAAALVTTVTTLPSNKPAGKKPKTANGPGVTQGTLWQLQRTMWQVTRQKNLAGCHRWLSGVAGAAVLQWHPGQATFIGLQNSKSVWASPMAASTITRARGIQVQTAVQNFLVANPQGSLVFGTFTLAHNRGQGLENVWDALVAAWHGITAGNSWVADCKNFGLRYWVKSTECTYGKNGWHVHLHVAFMLDKKVDKAALKTLGDRLYHRWQKKAVARGFKAPSRTHGVHLVQATGTATMQGQKLGTYLTKGGTAGLAKELAGGATKRGRVPSSLTPWQVLWHLGKATKGTPRYRRLLAIWHEWERASKGRRFMAWAKGAKAQLGVQNLTLAEIFELADAPARGQAYAVAQVPHSAWVKPQVAGGLPLASNVGARQAICAYVAKAATPEDAQKRAAYAFSQHGVPAICDAHPISPG